MAGESEGKRLGAELEVRIDRLDARLLGLVLT